MATPRTIDIGPGRAAEKRAPENEVFLELVLGDPDLLEAEFAAVVGDEDPGALPPGTPPVVTEVHGPGGPADLGVRTDGAHGLVVVRGRGTQRRSRERSPPQPHQTWLDDVDER